MVNKSSENPASINRRDQEALGRHRHLGLLRFKDWDAGYCNACETVYNVQCPNCQSASGYHGWGGEQIFKVEHPLFTDTYDGFVWTPTQCGKCDFRFKVIVH